MKTEIYWPTGLASGFRIYFPAPSVGCDIFSRSMFGDLERLISFYGGS